MSDVDAVARRVAERFLQAEDKKFDGLYDLQSYLSYERRDWNDKSKGKKDLAFIKRFGGVWMRLSWYDSFYNHQVYLRPNKPPRSVNILDDEAYKAWRAATSFTFDDIRKVSMSQIERKAAELAKVNQGMRKRRPKDTSRWRYKPRKSGWDAEWLSGKEAYKAWLVDVEEVLQDEIDSSARHGQDWTTQSLVGNILENYVIELEGMSRREMSKAISRLLNSMAKRKKIEKDTNEPRNPKWLGLNWVPRQRSRW